MAASHVGSMEGRVLEPRPSMPLLEVRGIAKSYGSAVALRSVDFTVGAGEIHALLGANGAGKSTLIRILSGAVSADAGEVLLDGRPVFMRTPQEAADLGLAFLHQELSLVPKFTAIENMGIGLLRRGRFGLVDRGALRRRAEAVADEIGINFPLNRAVEQLSVADRWLVALARALMRRARLIALDEPTASLSARETERLFVIVRKLAADGIGVLYVSHRLEEIEHLCSGATVFRDGRVVAELDATRLHREELITAITGQLPEAISLPKAAEPGGDDIVLEGRDLARAPYVLGVSLRLRKGEVLGVAGLVGAGRSELARLLFGADRLDSGTLHLDNREIHLRSPRDASRLGIAMVPEERRSQGLVMSKSAAFNLTLAFPGDDRTPHWMPFVSARRARARALEVAKLVALQPLRVDQRARDFSGGNQQKLVLGRWFLGDVRVLILDEPTRGVDVGARAQIHRLIRRFADDGVAVIIISSDFDELLGCDRVIVMAAGRVSAELTGDDITEDQMTLAAYRTSTSGTTC